MVELLISSSVLIAVLALLRLLLRGKISARLQYALWLLVLVRLLVPVDPPFRSPLSVADAASPVTARVERISGTLLIPERMVVTPAGEGPASAETVPAWTLETAAREVWFSGMFAMGAWFLFLNIRLARRLRRSRKPYGEQSLLPVYVAEGIPSPCLCGVLRPAVYLTERAAEDEAQARQIIAHELTHFRHGDMIWSLLRSLCLVVWWFDPLVWLAAALSRQDCELACDEGTIKALGEEARFDYGRTLVGMARVGTRPSDLLCGATTMTTGKRSLKERIARIASAPNTSAAVAAIVIVIAAVTVGCTFSGASEDVPAAQEAPPTVRELAADAADADDWLRVADILTVHAPKAEDMNLPQPPLHDVTLYDLDVSAAALRFTTDARPGENGFDFHAIEADGEYVSSTLVTWSEEPDENGRTTYTVFWEKPVDISQLAVVDYTHGHVLVVHTEPEVIGTYDREYWEKVEKELGSFIPYRGLELYLSDNFDETLPKDDIFGPLTLEDYVYGTDSWQFQYNGERIANDPYASIQFYDADGRTLWIMEDADALMIEEADGSITWATMQDGVDCADMIRHLLPWARGEYTPGD